MTTQIYSICQTIHPATSVEHSIICHFYNLNETNLVTAGANRLNVYRIIELDDISRGQQRKNSQTNAISDISNRLGFFDQNDKLQLEQLQSFELYGTTASLNKIKLGNRHTYERDSLVLSFNDAKLSIVQYNPQNHDLKTISMHYFEDDLRDGYATNHLNPPIARVDPENRCIAMLCYGKHIVLIPVDKDEEKDLEEELYDTSSSSSHSSSGEDSLIYGDDDDPELDIKESSNKRKRNDSHIVQSKKAPNPISYVSNTSLNATIAEESHQTKSPVLPSYIIDLKEEVCGERIDNIIDIQFLHNYNNPTLVLLHEPNKTWSGRIAMKQDTFCMVALSMNIHQRLHPIIWTVNNLPYDCIRVLPVPKPIGGLLIIACNEIIYLNQSVPAFGMTFNSFTKESSNFPLTNIPDSVGLNENQNSTNNNVKSTNPNSSSTSSTTTTTNINNNNNKDKDNNDNSNNISLRSNGSSTCDNSNSTDNMCDNEMDKANEDSVESNIQRYLNISLDLSQSVFLDYNKILFILKDGDVYLVTLFNDDMRSIKKFNFEYIAKTVQPNCLTLCGDSLIFIGSHVGDSILAEIVGDIKDSRQTDDAYADDDEKANLSEEQDEQAISLIEQGRLLSTSASGRICYGEASNISDNLPHDNEDPYVELITTSGYHESGAVCVMQRTIKPVVEDTYELKDCDDLWTLKPSVEKDGTDSKLLLNRRHETIAFSIRGELIELKPGEHNFETNEPTIFAANMSADNLVIQITSYCANLISDDGLIEKINFKSTVVDTCMSDFHIVALSNTDCLYHLQLGLNDIQNIDKIHDEGDKLDLTKKYTLSCQELGKLSSGKVVSVSLYKDVSGIFCCESNTDNNRGPLESDNIAPPSPSYWLFVVDDRGLMEIFSVPNMRLVYSVDNFPSHPLVLQDNMKLFVRDLDSSLPKTKEILMLGMGYMRRRPMLFVRSETELVVYEAYTYSSYELENHLKVRFRKVQTILLTTVMADENTNVNERLGQEQQQLAITQGARSHNRARHNQQQALPNLKERFLRNKHWLKPFKDIGNYEGIFLQGFRPHWIIMGKSGALRLHPMNVDGHIYAFSQFVDGKFICFTEKRELRIACLPKHFNLELHWPMKKFYLGETVHFVNYHVERRVYCVVTSTPVPCTKIMRVGNEPDSMKIEELKNGNGYIPPIIERFKLTLYDPEKWEQIPDAEIEFEEWEQVTCVKNVQLASQGTTTGFKGYIALSTNYCYGEDVPNRGRIFILDLIEVVPEPDRPLTKNKIKKVYCQEQKGPVTTLSHTCGLLMSAVGQKIYLWQLKEDQLDGVAFIDTQIYIHCAASVKNLIVVSDICKSISLLRYQQETRTLSMVCRDTRPLEVFACDFVVDNHILNFVVTDFEKNIIIYAHDPEHEESNGGTRLLRRADFHLGAHVTSFCRLRSRAPKILQNDTEAALHIRRKHLTQFCTVDGAIGFLYPISESFFRDFQMVQNELTVALPHVAGLNPKAWRCLKQARATIVNPCKLIVDGDLIERFLSLSSKERNDVARKIGSTTERILADIQFVQEAALHF